jgi:hypothetical protein
MELIIFVVVSFLFVLGIMYSVSHERPRTPQQIRNARAMRKWWRSFKNEGEIMIPFITGIILLGLIAYMTISSNI